MSNDIWTVGSLFSGIGGMDLGCEMAGMEIRWQIEIDPWCRCVLAKHWPEVRRYEDVRQVDVSGLEAVDVVSIFVIQVVANGTMRMRMDAVNS